MISADFALRHHDMPRGGSLGDSIPDTSVQESAGAVDTEVLQRGISRGAGRRRRHPAGSAALGRLQGAADPFLWLAAKLVTCSGTRRLMDGKQLDGEAVLVERLVAAHVYDYGVVTVDSVVSAGGC